MKSLDETETAIFHSFICSAFPRVTFIDYTANVLTRPRMRILRMHEDGFCHTASYSEYAYSRTVIVFTLNIRTP